MSRDLPRSGNVGDDGSIVIPDAVARVVDALLPRMEPGLDAAVVLGSGWNGVVSELHDRSEIDTLDVPVYPRGGVEGHASDILIGTLGRARILFFSGRVHAYEGFHPAWCALPAYLAARCGIPRLVVTNAAGGVHPHLAPGDLMLCSDALVLPGSLRFGAGFLGMGFDPQRRGPLVSAMLLSEARRAAVDAEIPVREGVYGFVSGPCYETRAEVAFFRRCGVDAVGMSTAPELIAARMSGVDTAAISCIANVACAVRTRVHHSDVLRTSRAATERMSRLLRAFLAPR